MTDWYVGNTLVTVPQRQPKDDVSDTMFYTSLIRCSRLETSRKSMTDVLVTSQVEVIICWTSLTYAIVTRQVETICGKSLADVSVWRHLDTWDLHLSITAGNFRNKLLSLLLLRTRESVHRYLLVFLLIQSPLCTSF